VQFCYDGSTYATGGCTGGPVSAETGFLTGVGNSTSSSKYLHQALGLVRWSSQTTNGAPPYTFDDPNNPGAGYAYNADGSLKQLVYPSMNWELNWN
jgi:hypothetical protein